MPKRTPADQNLIRQVYEQTGNAQEVARRLGLHPQTVYGHLRRMKKKCIRCRNTATPSSPFCADCLKWSSERKKTQRADRRRLGLCYECGNRVDAPVSRTLCAEHRIANLDKTRVKWGKRKRDRGGKIKRREITIKQVCGESGLIVWRRDSQSCVICNVMFPDKMVEIHHIDCDEANHAVENMCCLCVGCHRGVHGLLRIASHANAADIAAWVGLTYPQLRDRVHPLTD